MKSLINANLTIGLFLCLSHASSQVDLPQTEAQKNLMESQDLARTLVPLVVLKTADADVEMESQVVRADLNDVDVNSIKTIEVLKDYWAVDLYGEKAKDGVILIHLKNFDSLPQKTKKLFEEKKAKEEKRD